jgi:hypothetical protein
LEHNLFRELFFELDFESADAGSCTIKRSVHIVLGVNVPEHHPVTKRDVLPPFFTDDGFELVLLGFSSGSGLSLLGLNLLRVHLIVDFERAGGEHLEERLAVIADIEVVAVGGEEAVFIVDLEVEVGVGVAEWGEGYDLLVMKVLGF